MQLKTFKYTKVSGEVSYRTVYPIYNVDDKLLSIDLSDKTDQERIEATYILDAIHKQYLAAIRDAGFAKNYRYFFLEQME